MFAPSKKYMETLEALLRERGFRLKHLARGVEKLSKMFVEREPPYGEYFRHKELLASYAAYYAPVNALKVRWVLEELRKYASDFLDHPLRVLDYGSGPGSALMGLGEISSVEHKVTAVDFVPEAMEWGEALIKGMTPFRFRASTHLPAETFDLIFAANVFNELETPEPFYSLLDHLDPKGYLILVEPALMQTTHRVMELRDELVEKGWTIAAPCLPVERCPMRARADFWCHVDVRWTRPGSIQKLDDRVGLDKGSLKFSYLVITKEGARRQGTARVVSNLHKEKGKVWAWMCGGGETLTKLELLKRDRKEHNKPFGFARRGDVLAIPGFDGEKERIRLMPEVAVKTL